MIFTLEAQKRNTVKKSELTALRSAGMIPAVMYGKDVAATTITINKGAFQQCYKKSFNELAFYEINLDGKKFHTILKDKLVHPVTRNILHIDFMIVQETAQMEFEVPLQYIGEAAGNKEGGFTDMLQRSVKITCKAKDVPQEISVEISHLRVGDSLHVKDLPTGAWHYKDHADVALVVIHAKKKDAAAAEEKPAEAKEEK